MVMIGMEFEENSIYTAHVGRLPKVVSEYRKYIKSQGLEKEQIGGTDCPEDKSAMAFRRIRGSLR